MPRVPRGQILATTLALIGTLQRGRWTADELAAHLGIVRRTAYRILQALADAGVEVERHREGSCVYLHVSADALISAQRAATKKGARRGK